MVSGRRVSGEVYGAESLTIEEQACPVCRGNGPRVLTHGLNLSSPESNLLPGGLSCDPSICRIKMKAVKVRVAVAGGVRS